MFRSFSLAALVVVTTSLTACAAQTDSGDPAAETDQNLDGYDRQTVYDEVKGSAHAPQDLLKSSVTDAKLVAAIGWMVDHDAPDFYISAIRSDHHNDGQAAHAGGHCADMYAKDGADASRLITLAAQNPYVSEIGLGGAYKAYKSKVTGNKPYFNDNNATHLHIGVVHAFGH